MRFAANALGLHPPLANFEERLQRMRNFKSEYINGLGLSVLKLVPPGPEILDDELTANGRQLRPATLEGRQSRRETWLKEGEELVDYLKSIKTGSVSVSKEELGISESLLGDATMLPIVQLRVLKYVDSLARSWIGYNPTHTGFQFLQEGYQAGEWYGKKPRFKRPKVFRDLEKSRKVRRMSRETDVSTSRHVDEPAAPAPVEPTDQAPPGAHRPAESNASPSDSPNTNAHGKVKSIPGGKGQRDKLQFGQPITPEFINDVNTLVDQIRNGGGAEVERRLQKSLAYYGVDACAPDSDEESSSEDESDSSSEEEALNQPVETPSFDVARPQAGLKGPSTGFSKHTVGKWLGSF